MMHACPFVSVLLFGILHSASARNGYVASFTGGTQIAGTKTQTLDNSNTEIAKLATGFTITLWARFFDDSPNPMRTPMGIYLSDDGNFMQPFGGVHGGYEFTSGAVATVSALAAGELRNWHHYAVSWNQADGALKHYIDGTLINTKTAAAGRVWITKSPYLILGMNCYPSNYMADAYVECNPSQQFNGQVKLLAGRSARPSGRSYAR